MRLFTSSEQLRQLQEETAILCLHNPRVLYALASGSLGDVSEKATEAELACSSVRSRDEANQANQAITEYNQAVRDFKNFDRHAAQILSIGQTKYQAQLGESALRQKREMLTSPLNLNITLSGHSPVEHVSVLFPTDLGEGQRVSINGRVAFLQGNTLPENQARDFADIMGGTVERVVVYQGVHEEAPTDALYQIGTRYTTTLPSLPEGTTLIAYKSRVRFRAKQAESTLIKESARASILRGTLPLMRADSLNIEGMPTHVVDSQAGLLELSRDARPGEYIAQLNTAKQWSAARRQVRQIIVPSEIPSNNLGQKYKDLSVQLSAASQSARLARYSPTCSVTSSHLRQIKEAHLEGGYDRALQFLESGRVSDYFASQEEDASSVGFIRGTLAYMRRAGME